ncbi:MAG: sensor histidine kinase [Prosthecobacter sp.]|nr:sensor histidine kinase [Prosthecobacter sp.]
MRSLPRGLSLIIPTCLTLVVGWIDNITGWEVSLFIFYAIPIVQAVWWGGAAEGILISILSGAVWWFANHDVNPYNTFLGYFWALINREFYFIVVVFAVRGIRNRQEADAAYIQMLEERQQLEADIVSVSEHEQQRIGQDLHDGLCQQLAAIGCAARVLADDLRAENSARAEDAAAIEESLRQAVMEARDLARGIFPVHVDRVGLSAALSDLASTLSRLTGLDIRVEEMDEVHIDSPEAAMHLYRIAQEAVSNAARHANPTHILVKISQNAQALTLTIEDDGCGLGSKNKRSQEGMGLRTMRYRASIIGAHLHLEPRVGGGTRILLTLPLTSAPT